MKRFWRLVVASACLFSAGGVRGDEFSLRTEGGGKTTIQARLVAEGKGAFLLEKSSGEYLMVPQGGVLSRVPKDGPEPMTGEELVRVIEEKFGKERVRAHFDKKNVACLVVAGPMDKKDEKRATTFLKFAVKFFRTIETNFEKFGRELKLELEPSKFPMAAVVFESDDDFSKYAEEATGGQSLTASKIAGFYSPLSNWLVLRLGECTTYEVPLHESIHQLCGNRGVLRRMAPVPAWFHEGIATGFENNGEKISVFPTRISPRYARTALGAVKVDWEGILANDAAFKGDFLANEAYAHAWGLHWMLVTRKKEQYREYVKRLKTIEPLMMHTEEDRRKMFEETFSTKVIELQQDFLPTLNDVVRKQNINVNPTTPPGYIRTTSHLGEVEMSAVKLPDQGNVMQVGGQLRNLNPFRAMSFYVQAVTDSGMYAEWVEQGVESREVRQLKLQEAVRTLPGREAGPSTRVQIFIESALPESDAERAWLRDGESRPRRAFEQ